VPHSTHICVPLQAWQTRGWFSAALPELGTCLAAVYTYCMPLRWVT